MYDVLEGTNKHEQWSTVPPGSVPAGNSSRKPLPVVSIHHSARGGADGEGTNAKAPTARFKLNNVGKSERRPPP